MLDRYDPNCREEEKKEKERKKRKDGERDGGDGKRGGLEHLRFSVVLREVWND